MDTAPPNVRPSPLRILFEIIFRRDFAKLLTFRRYFAIMLYSEHLFEHMFRQVRFFIYFSLFDIINLMA